MKLLVISHDHALLPFAWRAKRQGCEVEVLVSNKRYAAAWEGRLAKLDVPNVSQDALYAAVRELALEQQLTVVTDSRDWTAALDGVPRLFGVGPQHGEVSDICIGGWWTGSEWTRRHWLLTERGLWQGGLGPALPGAILCVQTPGWREDWDEHLRRLQDALKTASFCGLVQAHLRLNPDGGLEPSGFTTGWPLFHAHAVLADPREEIAALLEGREGEPSDQRFSLVVPVSVPPWPHRAPRREEPRPISFPREATRWVFWHDLAIEQDGSMRTAGLGGLIGVARGLGRTPFGAQQRAMELIAQIQVAEKQFRADAGLLSIRAWNSLTESGLV